jgi:hypothetical protein
MTRFALGLVVALVALMVAPASADQTQGANAYALWAGGPWASLSTTVEVLQAAPATFWAMAWTWQGNLDGSAGGYVGVQTTTDLAIFSAPFAIGSVGDCITVEEYAATSCRLPLAVVPGRNYYLNVFPVGHDWWEATVDDQVIGELHVLGSSVPMDSASAFAEYFGPGDCSQVPPSAADFTFDGGDTPALGSCPASVHAYPWGATIDLGVAA